MKSKIQELIEQASAGSPCFRVYGSLIIDISRVRYIAKQTDGFSVHFSDDTGFKYTGDDWEEAHGLIREDFGPTGA